MSEDPPWTLDGKEAQAMDVRAFALGWRWTDPARRRLDERTLAAIRPQAESVARGLARQAAERRRGSHAGATSFRADDDPATVRWALEALGVEERASIVVSWNESTAVLTRWSVFLAHWGDFCYPMRDDVTVWSPGEDWTLAYERFEVFRLVEGGDASRC